MTATKAAVRPKGAFTVPRIVIFTKNQKLFKNIWRYSFHFFEITINFANSSQFFKIFL
jgi:hypothetical protein